MVEKSNRKISSDAMIELAMFKQYDLEYGGWE
jgi:hypothetical protein